MYWLVEFVDGMFHRCYRRQEDSPCGVASLLQTVLYLLAILAVVEGETLGAVGVGLLQAVDSSCHYSGPSRIGNQTAMRIEHCYPPALGCY